MRMKWIWMMFSILILFMVIGCQSSKPKEQDLLRIKTTNGENTKKVIFLMVDSLMYQAGIHQITRK